MMLGYSFPVFNFHNKISSRTPLTSHLPPPPQTPAIDTTAPVGGYRVTFWARRANWSRRMGKSLSKTCENFWRIKGKVGSTSEPTSSPQITQITRILKTWTRKYCSRWFWSLIPFAKTAPGRKNRGNKSNLTCSLLPKIRNFGLKKSKFGTLIWASWGRLTTDHTDCTDLKNLNTKVTKTTENTKILIKMVLITDPFRKNSSRTQKPRKQIEPDLLAFAKNSQFWPQKVEIWDTNLSKLGARMMIRIMNPRRIAEQNALRSAKVQWTLVDSFASLRSAEFNEPSSIPEHKTLRSAKVQWSLVDPGA